MKSEIKKINVFTSHRSLVDRRRSAEIDTLIAGHSLCAAPTQDEIAKIVGTLKARPVITPVLVDGKGHVIAGQGLVDAVKRLGCDTMPVYYLRDLSADDLHAYAGSLMRYADFLEIDRDVFRADTDRVTALADIVRVVRKKRYVPSDRRVA